MSPADTAGRKHRLQADLALLLTSLIWGSAFVVQRLAAMEAGVFLFNGLRFLLAALAVLPLARLPIFGPRAIKPPQKKELLGVLLLGLMLWGGAGFQQAGLRLTTAGNAGFITGLYVVFIPLILALGLRRTPRPVVWLAALLAAVGLFLLSTGGQMRVNPGDLLELVCAVFWACHLVLIGELVRRVDMRVVVIGQYLVCGTFSTATGVFLEPDVWPALLQNWWTVAYTGLLSVGLGYTLQALAQRYAPPADAAIILSVEAAFAAAFGWLFLGEVLNGWQLLGCGVMLAGMLIAQADILQKG
ncbi:MAG: DMT family transporter [Anaerolineales bacterium]|nr:DMT family transporter [Anaerolineales bacterium]